MAYLNSFISANGSGITVRRGNNATKKCNEYN